MPTRTRPRVGLVLGAGGVVGASYLAGALEGIRRVTGWEPADAEVTVGTSAGAFIGAIMATGLSPGLMYARCTGEAPRDFAPSAAMLDLAERMDRHNDGHWTRRYMPTAAVPRLALASPRLVLRALRGSTDARMASLATGLLGEGVLSTRRSIGAVVRTAFPRGWPTRGAWIVACDLDGGERVVFGREGAPITDLHVAVSAATAIPGVFAPVSIHGRRYCDAGLMSPSNLDVLAGLGLDAVLSVNPLSGGVDPVHESVRGHLRRSFRHLDRLARREVDTRLARERRVVERSGTKVFVIHPSAEDLAHFPLNSMNLPSRAAVVRRAAETTAQRLADGRDDGDLVGILRRATRRE